MSFFIPLNVYEEDIVQDAEQHTRELQIEEALELYQTALEYQRKKNVQQAHKSYQKLFNIEVLKLTYTTGLPPAAEKLKYLAYKNYSLLLLHELFIDSSNNNISRDDLIDRIGTILDWVSDALEYNSDDASFLHIVRLISIPLGYKRIERLALECICYSPERTVPLNQEYISANGIVGPQDSLTLVRLRDTILALNDTRTLHQHDVFGYLKNVELPEWLEKSDFTYSSITSRKDIADDLTSLITNEQNRTMDITISTVDWTSIGTVLQEALSSISKGRKKSALDDPYIYSVEPVNSVKFILPHGETIFVENEPSILPDQSMEIDSIPAEKNTADIVMEDPNKNKKRRSELVDLPARSSKRVKARSDVQTLDYTDMSVDEAFFDQLNSFISRANFKFTSVVHIFSDDEYSDHDQYIHDFKILLQCWDDEQADMYFRGENTSQNQGISSLSQALDFAALGDASQSRIMPATYTGLVNQFIYMINSGSYSLQDVRIRFIRAVLRSYRQESREFETKTSLHVLSSDKTIQSEKLSLLYDTWPSILINTIEKMLVEMHDLLYLDAKRSLFNENDSQIFFQLNLAESIFELEVEKFLELNKSVPSWERNKKEIKEIGSIKETYQIRIQSWYRLIRDLASMYGGESTNEASILTLRCDWVYIFYRQAIGSSPEDSLSLYYEIQRRQNDENIQNINIPFANYSHIPHLSAESVNTQISKVQATAVFAKVLDNSGNIDEKERARMLEAILIPEEQENQLPEHEAIAQFMSYSSSEFKLRLWYTLLEIYSHVGETTKSFDGFLRIFVSAVNELTCEEYHNNDEHYRQFTVIKTLHVCSDVSKNILRLLDENGEELLDNLSTSRLRETIDKIIDFLRMLHMYIFVADAITNNVIRAPSHLSWEKLVGQIRDNIVRSWALFYILFKRALPDSDKHPDILNDILSIVHESIGMRGFCGSADGYLLDLSLKEFVRMDWDESEADLLQCLHCRYGLGLGNEHFVPADHHCTPEVLTKSVPFNTSKFIIRMVMRKKNLTQSLLRTEVKNVLDQFYEVLDMPDDKEFPFGQNSGVLNRYLSQPITIQTIVDGLRGRLNLSFVDSNTDYMNLGKTGFYYAFAQAQYALFKIRNKTSSQELTSDLDECIQLFCSDLICNTNRFESWLMVAKAIDSLAADDLTWTAEKLNDPEKKKEVASRQRRSILACTMAINIHLQNIQEGKTEITSNIHYQQLSSTLWSTFAKLLYNATRPPMDMGAFEDIPVRLLFGNEGTYTKKTISPLNRTTATRIILKVLDKAIETVPSDWFNYYMSAKVHWNMKASASIVIERILQAVEHAPDKNTSHTDIAVEPHYKLATLLCKYVRNHVITAAEALNYLKKSFLCSGNQDIDNKDDEAKFYSTLLATLYKIRNADKKRWQHRPTFRIAKILDEIYSKKDQAAEEMSSLFTLKNNHRSAVMIWKPDLERPGEHYIFVFQYTMYFVDLLRDLNDSDSLMILAKKLRKFQSGMVNHHQAWEHLCSSVSVAIKRILDIDPKFNDIIPSLIYDEFEENAIKLTHLVEKGLLIPKLLGWLNYAQEFRKLNNSIGSTAALDDLFVAIYLNIYYSSLSQLESGNKSSKDESTPGTPIKMKSINTWIAPQTPQTKSDGETTKISPGNATGKARVTRRDITARATALLRAIPEYVRDDLLPKIVEVKGNNKPANGSNKSNTNLTVTIPNISGPTTPQKDNSQSDSDTDIEMIVT